MIVDNDVLNYIESKEDEVISFMQKLIQTRSLTGEEAEIGSLMEKECTGDGLEVEIIEPLDGRISIIASTEHIAPGPRMMMYSHYDTVPAGDIGSWE